MGKYKSISEWLKFHNKDLDKITSEAEIKKMLEAKYKGKMFVLKKKQSPFT